MLQGLIGHDYPPNDEDAGEKDGDRDDPHVEGLVVSGVLCGSSALTSDHVSTPKVLVGVVHAFLEVTGLDSWLTQRIVRIEQDMCGVSGIFDRDGKPADELTALVRRMAEVLSHRGPDDSGVWTDQAAGIALGHRRLSIIDLSAEGHQPMMSSSGRYVITFNGEVYNHRSLRAELVTAGHRFRGRSDTEVMLAAFDQWGLGPSLDRFNGMFAFALWDRALRTLSLVRDRLGEKPLYYGFIGRAFVFASELKAIRALPRFSAEIDRDALAQYLRNNYVPAPRSIYSGISKLSPGTVVTLRATDGSVSAPVAYWSAAEVAERGQAFPLEATANEAVDALDELVRDAVRIRMEADVPLGAFLSGGIDSSTIVALMQAQCDRPVRTFTIGFEDDAFNEALNGKAVARHLGTDHTELYVTPREAIEVVPELPRLYDEPFSDSSQIPTYLVSKLARQSVTVALSGDGGDELFGGYNRHVWTQAIVGRTKRLPRPIRFAFARMLSGLSTDMWDRIIAGVTRNESPRLAGEKVHKLARLLRLDDPAAMYRSLTTHWGDSARVVLRATVEENEAGDHAIRMTEFTESMMYLDLVTYLPDDILVKVDRATMAVGLEGRIPLLDHRVVEFAWRIPLSMKIHPPRGLRLRGGQGKWLLRQLLHRYVPPSLVERPKMGFGIPLGDWLRGSLRDWAEDLLDRRRIHDDGLLDPELIRAAWEEHLSGAGDRQYEIWDVLMFQAWLRATRSAVPAEVGGRRA